MSDACTALATPLDNLLGLQRAGFISAVDFMRMAAELTKDNATRLAETKAEDDERASQGSEELVDEDGMLFGQGSPLGSLCNSPPSTNRAPGDADADAASDAAEATESPSKFADGSPLRELSEASGAQGFAVGAAVVVTRAGKWPGTVTAIGSETNWLSAGKFQVKYEQKTRKGRGFTTTSVTAWVSPSDLQERVLSPRVAAQKAQKVMAGTSAGSISVAATRPHMRQPGFEAEDEEGAEGGEHPELAKHERGRKLSQKKVPTAALLGDRKTKETNVPIAQRLAEFKGHSLIMDTIHKNIFCRCCKQGDIKNIKETIANHVRSPTHQKALLAWLARLENESDVKEFLVDYYKENSAEVMSSLSQDVLLYRFNVMETFLAAGLPPTKIDELASLLAGDVCESRMMKMFIPKVEAFEFQRLRRELKDQKVTVIFDGTTRLGEAIVVLLRWCPADFSSIQMRLVTVQTAEKHMDGPELCAFINNILSAVCQIESINVVGGARDSCSTNGTAMRNLKVVMLELQDFLCVSHTLSKLGEHISLPTLSDFMTHWLGLVQHHPSAKRLWKEETGGQAMEGYSTIRWCSREVVQNELAVKLGTHVKSFVDKLIDREIGEAHPRKMKAILDSKYEVLQNELALSLDLQRIISTVHRQEGDGLLVLLAYDEIDALLTFGNSLGDNSYTLPNLARLLRSKKKLQINTKVHEYFEGLGWFEGKITRIANDQYTILYSDGTSLPQSELEVRQWLDVRSDTEWLRLVKEAKEGFRYLQGRLDGACNNVNYDCREMWEVLRLVKAFDPSFAAANLTENLTRDLIKITPLRKMGPDLLGELPVYLAAVKDFTVDHKDIPEFTKSVLNWWANNGSKFPAWARAARIVFSFTANSAAAERVFSLLKLFFGELRDWSLADMVQSTLMLRYNARKGGKHV